MAASDLELRALRLLVLIADLGSISAAARAERISQPSASARMKTLESRLGLELLDRRSQGAQLTENGRLVTDWARAVVSAAAQLATGARALSNDRAVRVEFAASQTIAEYLVPDWLARFRARHGDDHVRLQVTNSEGVVAAVRARTVDLGFVETPSVPPDLHRRQVGSDRLVVVVGADHDLARRRRPITTAQLIDLPLATREDGSGTLDTLRAAVAPRSVIPAVQLESNSAVKLLVAAGYYASVLSELTVAAELRDGRLVAIPLADTELRRSLHAVWRRGARLVGATADLLALVCADVRSRPAQPRSAMSRKP